jgi:two-component system cell cycle sensor histidine kinase/response regulator CckA
MSSLPSDRTAVNGGSATGGLAAAYDRILDENDAEAALSACASALVEATGARTAALWLLEDLSVTQHATWPAGAERSPALEPDLTALAARLAHTSGGAWSWLGGGTWRAACFAVEDESGRFALVAVWGGGLAALDALPPGADAARLATVGVQHARRCAALSRARAMESRSERWFKRLDEQIRVLDRERKKFAAMVGRSDSIVFVTDPSCKIRWANGALAATPAPADSGATWVGRSCRDVCARWSPACGTGEESACPVGRAHATGETVRVELHPHAGEEARAVVLTALPILGPDGRTEEIVVTAQDLSDLQVLRWSEARYRRLFERNTNALLMLDPTTRRIVRANESAARLFARPPGELEGTALKDLHEPAVWARLEPWYAQILEQDSATTFEATLRARDGTAHVAETRATRIAMADQTVVLLEFKDITESRVAQEALRAAEARLHAVVASAPLVLFALDREGRFLLSEGRALQSLGLSPGQTVGKSVYDVYRDVPEIAVNVRRALAGEEHTAVVAVGAVSFETHYAPTRSATGEVTGVIGVATDVTQSRRLEEQLRQSQKMEAIGRLAGGVAHDFNNLLTAMLGNCELLLSRLEPEHALRRHAVEIQKSGTRGALLARQLLSFGRRELLAPRVLDLRAVVSEMEDMLGRLLGEDVDYVTRFGDEPALVLADVGQVEQVLMNLVVNSRDAMPGGGRLTVEVTEVDLDDAYCLSHVDSHPGPHVMLAVSDSGIGMAADVAARVFEPFFTTKERGRGTGLGLSTVYGIVQQWGGHIGVYSEPMKGTAFKVYLPRLARAADAPDAPVTSTARPSGKETILLVEDEDGVREVARETLQLYGYRVLEARDGMEALAIAERVQDPIDLVLTDVVMPHLSGGQLVQCLAGSRPTLRVLFMSGYPDDAVFRNGLLPAGAEFVQKPFSLEGLARRVREVLDAAPRSAA